MTCPKCRAQMNTYNRNGVEIEQCTGCRGIFLDFGELEALTRLESQYNQAPPAAPAPPPAPAPQQPHYQQQPGPAWGAPHGGYHGGHYGYKRKSFTRMLFSS